MFALLQELQEPPWRELLLAGHNEFRETYNRWEENVEVARRKSRPGDILVLADETPNRALWLKAKCTAGECLMQLKQYEFALKQFDEALKEDPEALMVRQRRTVCLGRIGRYPEARAAADSLIKDFPNNAENWIRLGRVEKNKWMSQWWSERDTAPKLEEDATRKKMRTDAVAADAYLQEAIYAYKQGFRRDPTSYYTGINAVTLCHLQRHLAKQSSDPDMKDLEGAISWACHSALEQSRNNFWAIASLAQLSLHRGPGDVVKEKYQAAVAQADNDLFALDSTRETLYMLGNLEYRPDEVKVALGVMTEEPPWKPRQVLLFSGHRIDPPDRPTPCFPNDKAEIAAWKIAEALEALGVGEVDLALTQCAAGGDILFAEACAQRGVRIQLLQPFPEPEFIQDSILPSAEGENWRARYFKLKMQLKDLPRSMPDELGPPPKGVDPYERCNLWLLYTALAWGVDKVRFLCLWNGDGGITAHMMSEVKKYTGRIHWLNTREL